MNFDNLNAILDQLVEDISCGVPPAPPDVPLKFRGNPPNKLPLDVCEGDCDTDDDCKGCLKCFKRSQGEFAPVPGCSGGSTDGSANDYCYAP